MAFVFALSSRLKATTPKLAGGAQGDREGGRYRGGPRTSSQNSEVPWHVLIREGSHANVTTIAV